MKRIIITFVFFAICLSAAFIETVYVSSQTTDFESRIEETDRLVNKNNFERAIGKISEIESDWNETSQKIDTLLIHDYVDNAGLSISRMKAYLESLDTGMYFAESKTAKKTLASLRGSEYPYFENIF